MSQKKISNLLKLKEELKQLLKEKAKWGSDYYSKCNELDTANAKIEAYERSEDFVKRILAEQNHREIERLTDIIRWHIKPETAVIKKVEDFPHHRF